MTKWLEKYPAESVIQQAYRLAEEAHRDAKREDGRPYISHCLKVAETVAGWGLDEASVAAALLHDIVEDTDYTVDYLKKHFGPEISFLVDGLTKLSTLQYPNKEEQKVESLRKFIISFTKDLRVVIIKLADRLHNMETLSSLPPERQKKLSWETAEIYAPLAYRLGMQKLSGELEDLAFPYLYPDEYQWLIKEIESAYDERQSYAQKLVPIVTEKLAAGKIKPFRIDARAKRYSSLYKKLMRYDMDIDNIHDLVALRIVVDTVEECYMALGIIHQNWQPLQGKVKDYIARPKLNGYRSIHTTVFCVDNKITEFQIRTREMHEEAEMGIAAHWAYQQIKSSKQTYQNWGGITEKKELAWVEQLRNWQNDFTDHKEFIEAVKTDLFKDRIFAMTPQNDIIDLPAGATPVDFAYRIHSDVGDQCVGAKVNGKITPLDYELKNGDIVEIVTQKGKKPSEDWLRFIKTNLALKHVKSKLRGSDRSLIKRSEDAHMEFKIINRDRPGYLKDVTKTFAEMKINIIYLNSSTEERMTFSNVVVRCEMLTENKIQKLLVKLKKIAGTKEIGYRFNR
jgi:GTP diphosphokinase / guanosine-3',5'-bis(diphosphate) 3'-diphosphatase